ncbi:hypothetical protein MHL30_16395 [Priestia flexa]|uniref:hypothetical protein n=1 Tax=Priestia flexa TaxID=86664 RepID=UPI001EF40376|nr:hypothetical protein [Priestia flexa]MCG7314708.1 hypothetical protein [Priestia flexa]
MNLFIMKRTNVILLLIGLIMCANFIVYRTSAFGPVPNEVVIGSLLDFLMVIPLLLYVFIFRQKPTLHHFIGVISRLSILAYIAIPKPYFTHYSLTSYLIFIIIGLLTISACLYLYRFLSILPLLKRSYLAEATNYALFPINLEKALETTFHNLKTSPWWLHDLSILYYTCSFKKKVHVNGSSFSYHKSANGVALNLVIIHAIVLETVGVHYFLHQWSPALSMILLLLNIYGIVFMIAEIQAIRLSPYVLTTKELILQTGLTKRAIIPLATIKEIKWYDGAETFTKAEQAHLYDARLNDFVPEKPTFEIQLHQKQTLTLPYGITKEIDRIVLNVDDKHTFYTEVLKCIK